MLTQSSFQGNKFFITVIPAACLSLLTIGTVSAYGIPDDFILPAGFLTVIILFTILLIFLRIKTRNIP